MTNKVDASFVGFIKDLFGLGPTTAKSKEMKEIFQNKRHGQLERTLQSLVNRAQEYSDDEDDFVKKTFEGKDK